MVTYASTKSKEEIIQTIKSNTRPYSLADTGGGFYTSWIRENYFELTYPFFSGQASFCGEIVEDGKDTVIKGKFGMNHIHRIIFIVFSFIIFLAVWLVTKRSGLSAVLTIVALPVMFFGFKALSLSASQRGNEMTIQFIEKYLL